jgi:hypothetical protein
MSYIGHNKKELKTATVVMYADESGWLCSAYDGDVSQMDELPEDREIAARWVDPDDSAANRKCECEGGGEDNEHDFGEHMAFAPLVQELAELGYDRLVWDDRIFDYPSWAKGEIEMINKAGLSQWKSGTSGASATAQMGEVTIKMEEMMEKAAVPPEYDGSVKLDDHVAQVALRRIAAAGLADKVAAGHHAWVLNFELSASRAGFSMLRPLREFRVVLPVFQNVASDVARIKEIESAIAGAGENATLLGAILCVLGRLEIVSPRVGRNKENPMVTEFRGEKHMLGVVITEDTIAFL